MKLLADQIRVSQFPFAIEIHETTDLSDLLAPSNLIAKVSIGTGESRHHATARALIIAAFNLLSREQE